MKLLGLGILCVSCMIISKNQTENKMIWISQCDDVKIISIENRNQKISIEVYGSIQINEGETLFYVGFGENIEDANNCVGFDLKSYKVSYSEIFENDKVNFITNNDVAFLIPDHIDCRFNSNKQELNAHITKSTYFSRFDSCVFNLKEK